MLRFEDEKVHDIGVDIGEYLDGDDDEFRSLWEVNHMLWMGV